ncbi:JmjC domain-containing protein 4 [Mortierella sp. AM989]|nr:JmjC domain-containing protein 4 [Mortierella sp. AM989]
MASPPTALHSPRDYSSVTEIAYHESCLSYNTFFQQYLEPNLPVIVGPELTKHWRARQQWVCSDTGKPNFENLREQLCTTPVQVPVADCQTKDFTDQKRSTMDLRTFLNEWEANSLASTPSRTYLKDFHFVRTFPHYDAYETPDIFRDDWMNEFWTRRMDMDDDYRFVYCGGDGTFTPFHADVYRSYSWSANICGIKKWTLFPPDQEHLFCDSLKNTVYDIENVDPVQFPNFHKAKRFIIYQQPGQTLFVPSGWWHQVHNIGDTISINHNWCNGSNLDLLLESICSDLKDVEREIEHLKEMMEESEWIETCQKLLLLNSGWDWSTLWHMCVTIRERVQRQMESEINKELALSPVSSFSSSANLTHATFIKDGKVAPRTTPIFQSPLVSQQPPLDLTIRRVDAVQNYIRNEKSAKWFLEHIKNISLDG